MSLVAIFLPIGFMSGIIGRFMKSFGLTMAFAVMVSLLVSFTLTPMLAARWLKVRRQDGDAAHPGPHLPRERWFGPIDRGYTKALEWALSHRRAVALVAFLVLLSSAPLFMIVNKNFLPVDDQSEFEIGLRAPEGTSLQSTEIIANRIAAAPADRLSGSRLHDGDRGRRLRADREHRRRSTCAWCRSASAGATCSPCRTWSGRN